MQSGKRSVRAENHRQNPYKRKDAHNGLASCIPTPIHTLKKGKNKRTTLRPSLRPLLQLQQHIRTFFVMLEEMQVIEHEHERSTEFG